MCHPRIVAVLMMSVFLLTACASVPATRTEVSGSWKADNYNGKLSDFLVISRSDEPGIRGKVESILVESLEKQGLRAVASSDIMPADEEINRKTVRAAMAGKGFDGVLVSRLLGVGQSAVYVQPSLDTTFENSFDAFIPIVASPGYVEHLSVVSLQIDLYDTASKRLVWSLKTQTSNFSTVDNVVRSVSEKVLKDLRARGLI